MSADPWQFQKIMARFFSGCKASGPRRPPIDIALMDWVGKKLESRSTAISDSIPPTRRSPRSPSASTRPRSRERKSARPTVPVLKVKVGLDTDEATIEAVRSVTKKPLRVDANEGWKDKEEAVRKINWLEKQGVEFIEQPMPAEMLEETRWVRTRVHIPDHRRRSLPAPPTFPSSWTPTTAST